MNTNTQKRENIPKTSQWKQMLHFPRAVYILVIGTFFNRLGFFVLPYMALYLKDKGYDVAQIGSALASYGLGTVVASVIGGHLADTLGRRNTIVISMFGSAAMMVCLSQVEDLFLFQVIALLAALFTEAYRPASHALIADVVDEKDRVMVYALLRWAINAGWAMGPAIAGMLTKISYLWIFLGDASTSILFGILAAVWLPQFGNHEKVPLKHIFDAFGSIKKSIQHTFVDYRFMQVFLSSFPIAFIFNQSLATLSFEVQNRGFDEFHYGLILGFNGAIIILTEIPLSMWVNKQPQRTMIVSGYALIGIGFGLFALAGGLVTLYIGMAIFTLGEMIALPVSLAYMSSLAPADMRGRYMGVWGLAWSVSMMISTTLGIQMHASMGYWFWIFVGALGLLSAWIMSFNPYVVYQRLQSRKKSFNPR